MPDPDCPHKNCLISAAVNHLMDTGRYQADIRIRCADCGLPFRFLGLPVGVDLAGAAVSASGEEVRLAILPRGQAPAAGGV